MGLRTRIENAVEHTGLRQVAQYIRLVDWLKESDDATISSTEWAMNVMQIEYSIREIVQQETNVSEKCQRLYQEINAQGGVASSKQTQQLKDWKKELSVLNREYWRQERKHFLEISRADNNGFLRAFKSYRQKPKWHLHSRLCADCAGRGGCYGRDCGCCEKPRSTIRAHQYGHCTTECSCCEQHRKFALNEKERGFIRPDLSDPDRAVDTALMINANFMGFTEHHLL